MKKVLIAHKDSFSDDNRALNASVTYLMQVFDLLCIQHKKQIKGTILFYFLHTKSIWNITGKHLLTTKSPSFLKYMWDDVS